MSDSCTTRLAAEAIRQEHERDAHGEGHQHRHGRHLLVPQRAHPAHREVPQQRSERSEHHGPAESDARRKLDALLLPALAGQDDGEAGLLDATRVLMLCAFGGDLRS